MLKIIKNQFEDGFAGEGVRTLILATLLDRKMVQKSTKNRPKIDQEWDRKGHQDGYSFWTSKKVLRSIADAAPAPPISDFGCPWGGL